MRRTSATRNEATATATATKQVARSGKDKAKVKEKEGYRETVEALVVAFILALLVRGFEAEAFVIPTGSMAPTLMGRHKEITCPQCGYVYTINASEEDEGGRGLRMRNDDNGRPMVVSGTCVNCRFQTSVVEAPTFNGDRILVMKFPYDLPFLPGAGGPNRWDVVVFRYPEEPEVSYIKRLVGLPGEELRIYFGDIYIKSPGSNEFHLERKPLRHQRAMQMMVYDDRNRPEAFKDKPEWRRWTSAGGAWKEREGGVYVATATAGQDAELRYGHLVPDPEQWQAILSGEKSPRQPRPSLITDFYSYNSNVSLSHPDVATSAFRDSEGVGAQPHWVGDLSTTFRLKVNAAGGTVRFELIEGGTPNRCEIDLTTGVATLRHGDQELGTKSTKIKGPGNYGILFANVDDRLTLLVDDEPVFGDGITYPTQETHAAPTAADLSPVGIVARGASVEVSDLVLKRDIYYTQNPGRSDYGGSWEHGYQPASDLFAMLSDPSQFEKLGKLEWKDFPIGRDRYMMLGDNSPRSKDSRGWSNADRYNENFGTGWDSSDRAYYEVPRAMLTGKAFFVYWPHGVPFGPNLTRKRDFRFPFRPYFERMKWIR